jgi:glutamate formiminotransferase / 5-formyltetrahydrofolate cyclo-ligase
VARGASGLVTTPPLGEDRAVLECVVNLSEGRSAAVLAALADAVGPDCLDVHTCRHHHRSVWTLVGETAPRALTRAAVELLDIGTHTGAHPRIGVVDVVPFVALDGSTEVDALAARDRYARWAADELGLPCFFYGPERTLPEVRRGAFTTFTPDTGPAMAHPTAGAVAVGARPLLVAYNLWLAEPDPDLARSVAREVRAPGVRALGLAVGDEVQVSMNLVDPLRVGPAQVFDAVAGRARIARAELVGLVPDAVLAATPPSRWAELDLSADVTIGARLRQRAERARRGSRDR